MIFYCDFPFFAFLRFYGFLCFWEKCHILECFFLLCNIQFWYFNQGKFPKSTAKCMRFYLNQKSFLSCIFGILGKKDLDSGFILSILRRKGNLGKSLKAKTDLQSLEGKKYQCHFSRVSTSSDGRNSFALLHIVRNSTFRFFSWQVRKECKKSFITKKCNKRHIVTKLHLAAKKS